MRCTDFLICLLDASAGNIQGRTLLQKRAFFVCQDPNIDVDLDFIPHYYGPFSPTLDVALGELKSLGFVDETTTGFGLVGTSGFEVRRHDYHLTDDGKQIARLLKESEARAYQKIAEGLQRIKEAGDPNYLELSVAAKAFFILKRKNRPLTHDEVLRAARDFNWNISEQSLGRAVSFLEKLGLVQTG